MRYRQFGDKTGIMSDGSMKIVGPTQDAADQEVHIHLSRGDPPPEDDEDELPVTDSALRRMVDRLGPHVKRTRVSDDEEAFSTPDVLFPSDLTKRRSADAVSASARIREQERHIDNFQRRADAFWEKNQPKR